MTNRIILMLSVGLFCMPAWHGIAGEQNQRYMSERSHHKFLGATRIVLSNFDGAAKDAKSALLQFDRNDVVFSTFGDSRITTVFYKPFEVKLTQLKLADPEAKGRRIYGVELPAEFVEALGKNSLRLVAPVAEKGQAAGARLLLADAQGKTITTLDLRPTAN
jgi:hypothetical protein